MDIRINGAKILYVFDNVPIFGTVRITQTLIVSWLVMGMIAALALWLGNRLKVSGISRKQAAAEMLYNALTDFVRGNMGTQFDRYIPLVGTLFITSVLSSLIGLLGIWSPTADLMTTLAWGITVFVLITYHKIRSLGFGGYCKGFLKPFSLLLPVNLISEFFIPVSMACRHFGNILSGAVITALIYAALTDATQALFQILSTGFWSGIAMIFAGVGFAFFSRRSGRKLRYVFGGSLAVLGLFAILTGLGVDFPWLTLGIPALPSLYFDWFGSFIQAFIFCTLTTLFIKQAASD